MLSDYALLSHLPANHPARKLVENDAAKFQAGWIGEQTLAYFLEEFQQNGIHIFYGLHLDDCQIDTLLLAPTFIAILEVKNYAGTICFANDHGQLIRYRGDRREGFANPILQADRHRLHLEKWFLAHRLPKMPIEADVVIAHPSTVIDNPSGGRRVQEHVFHAEQVQIKLQKIIEKYQKSQSYSKFLPKIEQQLLHDHHEPFTDVLQRFNVKPSELLSGVRCGSCGSFTMQRIYTKWVCTRCGHDSKSAHEPMILHYFLLFGAAMTNKQCRDFLQLSSKKVVIGLLKKMNIERKGIGPGRGQYYVAPPHEIFDQTLKSSIKVRNYSRKKY
ncbi:NERD domain-containing protein [Sporolactobacillus sp. CPB3-1]|uniref:NERD domain-containing protein n=1 Tax=Sporolactobacillus mangiferae TaxID=2940498 RepID=A0ABT0M9H4_9BACL|nr:NERD domain-containing protein [Sporolactobacillus mangiferae]MCL1631514.1 NERD domain-containing protein [Sporolactobacillus mangiferae]